MPSKKYCAWTYVDLVTLLGTINFEVSVQK
jgi:hypothetical protein